MKGSTERAMDQQPILVGHPVVATKFEPASRRQPVLRCRHAGHSSLSYNSAAYHEEREPRGMTSDLQGMTQIKWDLTCGRHAPMMGIPTGKRCEADGMFAGNSVYSREKRLADLLS